MEAGRNPREEWIEFILGIEGAEGACTSHILRHCIDLNIASFALLAHRFICKDR